MQLDPLNSELLRDLSQLLHPLHLPTRSFLDFDSGNGALEGEAPPLGAIQGELQGPEWEVGYLRRFVLPTLGGPTTRKLHWVTTLSP